MPNLTIPDLIGRNRSHGGNGGGWSQRGDGRRRQFAGPGGSPYFAYPWFPPDEVVELSPGVPVQIVRRPRTHTLLSGAGIGREDRELADLGAVIAPGSSGITLQLALDANRRLCASICIDGECYQGSVDLSGVLEGIASGIAQYHASLHEAAPSTSGVASSPAAIEDTANAANVAVEAAGDLLVGALIDQHCTTLSAGLWHSLTHAVYGVHHAVAKTVQQFKGPITVAASAVATVYGGPAAGAAAAKFTGPLIDGVANDFRSQKDTKVVIDAAHEAAKTDPRIAKALADAHKAVADTAAAYHITATAADAAAGDPVAAQKVADLDRAASNGDLAAQQAMSVITQAFAAAASNRGGAQTTTRAAGLLPFAFGAAAGAGGYAWWRRRQAHRAERAAAAAERAAAAAERAAVAVPLGTAPDRGSLGDLAASSPATAAAGELIGAAITTLRRAAQAAVQSAHERQGATALAYVKDGHGAQVLPFPTLDDADDWFGALDPRRYLYAAYFDAADPTWPSPINEALGGPAAAAAHSHVAQGQQ
jgi:hypothetical protein